MGVTPASSFSAFWAWAFAAMVRGGSAGTLKWGPRLIAAPHSHIAHAGSFFAHSSKERSAS